MAKITLHSERRKQNSNKGKAYKPLTRVIYFISIITILSLTTAPAYSENQSAPTSEDTKLQNIVIEKTQEPSISLETNITQTPLLGPEEELEIVQKKILTIATEQIGTCGKAAVQKYTQGKAAQWCSEFVSWVYNEAGITFSEGQKTSPWMLANSQQIVNWFRTNNRYHSSKSNYFPKRGDYVQTRNSDGSLHSAIIIDIIQDPETNQTIFVTIDGNWNGCVKQVEKHNKSNILGFGEIAVLSF